MLAPFRGQDIVPFANMAAPRNPKPSKPTPLYLDCKWTVSTDDLVHILYKTDTSQRVMAKGKVVAAGYDMSHKHNVKGTMTRIPVVKITVQDKQKQETLLLQPSNLTFKSSHDFPDVVVKTPVLAPLLSQAGTDPKKFAGAHPTLVAHNI
jgi:hypothetical protein